MLIEYKDALEDISMYLYKRENITGEEFMEILRKYKNNEQSGEEGKEDLSEI